MLLALDRAMPGWAYDADGRLAIGSTNLTKASVDKYWGAEITGWRRLGLAADRMYWLLRHPTELEKAAPTFNGLPLLIRHLQRHPDPGDVIGATGTDAKYEHPYLTNSLHIWAQHAIDGVESGARAALSAGYAHDAEMRCGTYQGVHYDGVMRAIVGHHVALVPRSRPGADMIIGSSNFANSRRAA